MVARTSSGRGARNSSGSAGVISSGRLVSTSSKDRNHGKPQPQPLSTVVNNSSNTNSGAESATSFSHYPKIDNAILTMKSALGRFTRANDRRMVLRTLKEVKYLKALPIDPRPPPMVDLEELELEVAKESLVLNGQAFHPSVIGVGNDASANASMISSLAVTLSPDTLYYDLLCRLARTITSSDCYAKLNEILGSHELNLMNASAERKPKIKKGKPGFVSDTPPIEINIFEEGGNIHAHIVTTLGFGLYRKLDVNTGRPWIKMQVELNERMNFSSGSQVRHITIHWPDMYV
ncbi:expressed unknown protein [Seminavis robusta]|uniref:Uncharacterized protein n=1 Tax=Seminavis robusta TaxID=568900 RepID=A0A9N8E3U4_9STRA|nr:expressed unknown protein [Seminavis robusta]|eukprot:Sro496_g154650.1 n/a (291) ;mRNA; f:55034-56002